MSSPLTADAAGTTVLDWFRDARYGVAQHILGDGTSPEAYQASINAINVEAIAGQLAEVGAGYYLLTLGQNNGYFNAPNNVYDQYTGRGDRSSRKIPERDLPREFITALRPHGIKLMLYLPCGAPSEDEQAARGLGVTTREPRRGYDWALTPTFRRRWSEVIQAWADGYGEEVVGWWFDGAFTWSGFDESYAQAYAAAVKHGNPNAIVAFNPGVRPVSYHSAYDDYLAGEQNEPTSRPEGRWIEGKQWHTWTFLGTHWAETDTRYDNQTWVDYVQAIVAREGVITLDVGPTHDGTISPAQMEQLRAIQRAGRTEA